MCKKVFLPRYVGVVRGAGPMSRAEFHYVEVLNHQHPVAMRGERPHLNFCHTLSSKCPGAPRFQPNPHLKWPTLAVHFNDCIADIGHPPAQLIALKTLRDE
eukprot:scaffold19525_cov68-Cyclotella_meneghiniana.AAC.3